MKAGFEKQSAPKDYLIIDQPVRYRNDEKGVDIVALPTDDYRITVMVDYHNPALGSQHTGLFDLEKEFVKEFSPCRTFCFLHEVEMLHDQGLIRGGNLDNAIVIVDRDLTAEELQRVTDKLGIKGSVILEAGCVAQPSASFLMNPPATNPWI
jgi:UDP-3-O-[3-hydroxymyristoyl] N-acetylglucosamine deacetylase/3-hydroxyacyl-[acyl-carrier-protein] dehydratase